MMCRCHWCQRLEPTWAKVVQEVHRKYPESDGRLRFAKVCPIARLQTLLPMLMTYPVAGRQKEKICQLNP